MKIKYLVITITLMLVSFLLGARIGVSGFVQADAKYKAGTATADLKRLDEGDIEGVRESLKFSLFKNLGLHAQSKHNLFSFLWPELGILSNKNLAQTALNQSTNYYKDNIGSFISNEELLTYPQNSQIEFRETLDSINELVTKHAQ